MTKVFTSSEVQAHNSRKSCWIVIKNDVYDVTRYLEEHPGGEEPLLDSAGMDATTAFEEVGHSSDARKKLKQFKIGSLAKGEKCARLRPRLWMSRGPPTIVYRCENDKKPWRTADNSSNRSKSPPLQKCYSKSESSLKNSCSKSTVSPKSAVSKTTISSKRSTSRSTITSKRSGDRVPKIADPPKVPLPIPRVSSIVVPRESGSKLKWALLALAIAIVAGVAYKKYAAN